MFPNFSPLIIEALKIGKTFIRNVHSEFRVLFQVEGKTI